ncbi:uncharacterized protein LOC131241475 [Magnolia sinica]|uniref:uncharacterized protein LOC131241475 n=1 Tax=Magnolia sinica TaxID=86752 RepID=UPI00265B13A7|nr:uncharacterized protein LOC131241475 [Magnolia sinica]
MEIQQHPPPNPTSLTTLQSSIQNLITNWNRRQRLHRFVLDCTIKQEQQQQHVARRAPWRAHLASFLESTPAHLLFLSLLLLDLILTVLELSSSLLTCNNKNKGATQVLLYHWGGIAILTVLSVRTLALSVALGCSFFRQPGRVVDGLVLIGALILEVLVEGQASGLLVVVSLWRVVRVVESAFELSDEAIEAQIEGIVCQFEVIRNENERLWEAVAERDERIAELEEELARRGDGCLHGHHLMSQSLVEN